jgi:hypothetical protein
MKGSASASAGEREGTHMKIKGRSAALLIAALMTLLGAFCGCGRGGDGAIREPKDPFVPDDAIFRPAFVTREGTYRAGTAFAVSVEAGQLKETLLLTAMHLMGPSGGLRRDIPQTELPEFVKSVRLNEAYSGKKIGNALWVISLPKACQSEINFDVAAFKIPDKVKVATLQLAEKQPLVDQPVWLAASVIYGENPRKMLHKCRVVESGERELVYEYENPNLNLTATSGAPIINSDGRVVGINVRIERQADRLLGRANPSASVRQMLKEALNK